jgi:mannitol-specific phosphotransferase system IIBC component
MKKTVAMLCFLLATSPLALAQDKAKQPSAKQKAQQERMKDCNAQAKDKKGEERKKFMSVCLKGGGSSAPAGKKQGQK